MREAIEEYPVGVKKLKGHELFRRRVGNFRIIFNDKGKILKVELVGNRGEIYRRCNVETIREQITGALAHMDEIEIKKVWDIIQILLPAERIPEIEPDDIDLAMIEEIEENPDCKEFISGSEAYTQLGWK